MAKSLEGQIALVTGAARGIGRACALELARCGADLALNDLNESEALQSLIDEIRGMGCRALVCIADVSDVVAVEQMFAHIDVELGPLDILINNAASSIRRPFIELSAGEIDRMLSVDLRAVLECSRLAVMRMATRGRGNIVMISSVHAERPYPKAAVYNSAKAGVNHFAKSLALELAESGVRVNVLEPGWIDTPGERRHNSEGEISERAQVLPMKRLGRPEEVAQAAVFLCSQAASYITGATLRVDGGFALKF